MYEENYTTFKKDTWKVGNTYKHYNTTAGHAGLAGKTILGRSRTQN
jgi:hypothetical protein